MKKILLILSGTGLGIVTAAALLFSVGGAETAIAETSYSPDSVVQGRVIAPEREFEVDVLVNGQSLQEYLARGRRYVEAAEGAEYEIRIRNPYPFRVAVALSVDGLNSIDARRTSAWNASKWVIGPHGTIHVTGWQMSSERARRFYFTTERDSYAAKLGQTTNLGAISAVFFRERRSLLIPIAPPRSRHEEDGARDRRSEKSKAPSASASGEAQAGRRDQNQPAPMQTEDEYAATGIGRSVRNDVRFVDMNLESRPAGEVNLRYEYYPALVRLGILPRQYPRIDPLRRREGATGFEDRRFSPEP